MILFILKILHLDCINIMKRNLQSTNTKFQSVPKTPAKNNRAPIQRPKKCPNCLKMIAANKYVFLLILRLNIIRAVFDTKINQVP